jgi:hypothetical protein
MFMRWDGVTLDQYEEARKIVKWEDNVPEGAVLHISTHDGKSLRVTDVWESAEDLNNFVNNRLMPVTIQLGITNQPQVEVYPLHAIFAPAFEQVEA